MPHAEFISTYQGITYKVPESDKYARFHNGRLVTKDEQIISYLREHPDYGVTLTEIENPTRRGITVDICICPECKRTFKTKEALAVHLEKFHKVNNEAEVQEDGQA
jgi:hypothetical protein